MSKFQEEQKISFLSKDFEDEIFFDHFLRKCSDIPNNIKLNIDISETSNCNDFQISSLPFILSFLKKDKNIDLSVEYPSKGTLFEEDSHLDYLNASGFFDFIENHGIKISRGTTYQISSKRADDQLLKFQSFRNISEQSSEKVDGQNTVSESANLFLDLSSTLKAIFENEIFLNCTTSAEKVRRVITKELLENINQHSEADLALLRFKYIRNVDEIIRKYGNISMLKDFMKSHKSTSFFVVTISDNGKGIINTLKKKYQEGFFVLDENDNLNTILKNSNSWWLEKAFESHKTANENIRTRLGLKDILDTVCDYNGMLYLRSHDSELSYSKHNGTAKDLTSGIYHPFISGTHYMIIFPADIKQHRDFSESKLYQKLSKEALEELHKSSESKLHQTLNMESLKEMSEFHYREFDISYRSIDTKRTKNIDPKITRNIEVSFKYPEMMIEVISDEIEKTFNENNGLLALDFSNTSNVRFNEYSFILEKLFGKYKDKLSKYCILRNVSDEIISNLRKSDLSGLLKEYGNFLIVFNLKDNISFLGIAHKDTEKELHILCENVFMPLTDLNDKTIELIKNNERLIRTAIFPETSTDIAFLVDFNSIFFGHFESLVHKEKESCEALIEGKFLIGVSKYANKYLIAPFMFLNPDLCRLFAKEIYKKMPSVTPDILLTYSSTGIVIYWYLKNYYFSNLRFMLINNSEDITLKYGEQIREDEKVLIVADVKCTGSFITKLRDLAINLSGSSDNILGQFAIFDINKEIQSKIFNVKTLFDGINVTLKSANEWDDSQVFKTGHNIDFLTGVPSVKQKEMSNLNTLINKNELKDTKIEKKEMNSEILQSWIDDNRLTEIELYSHWKSLETIFLVGHRERNDNHFKHYDQSEQLLFKNNITLHEIRTYIQKMAWSFNDEIHYVIFSRYLPTTLLAHLVATCFLKKPRVVEATKYPDGSFVLPPAISRQLKNKNVFLVDTSINTGNTMFELIGLVNLYGGNVSGIFSLSNRATPEVEIALRNLTPKIACAYRLQLEVFKKSYCDLCKYAEHIDDKKQASATKDFNKYLEEKRSLYEIQLIE